MRPRLLVLLSSFLMATPSTALPQEFTGREHAHAMLLLSQSDKDVRLAAWSLYHLEKDILDRAAERIYRSRQEKDEQLVDGLAWLCRVIAKSGDGRYGQLLLEVSSSAATSKLRSYASKTASGLKETPGGSFIPVSN
jgi:hypothetical protein